MRWILSGNLRTFKSDLTRSSASTRSRFFEFFHVIAGCTVFQLAVMLLVQFLLFISRRLSSKTGLDAFSDAFSSILVPK